MAPRIPQKIDAEIYEMINGAINSGETISEFQFQGLIHKAKKMSVPRRYACLSAVYSYAFNFDLVIENALNSVKYGIDDPFCVDNALYALSNNLLYKEIVNISKNNPLVLRHEDSLNTVYESAIYSFDFDYCEYINNMFKVESNMEQNDYINTRNYFNNDASLISKAAEYINYAMIGLSNLYKKYKIHSNHIGISIINEPLGSYLEFNVVPHNISVDKSIDLESEWHSHIAKFDISEAQLCNISFNVRCSE